jgi:uncharacterized LabA/DUF88 family protein
MGARHTSTRTLLGPVGLLTVAHDGLNHDRLAALHERLLPGVEVRGRGKEDVCAAVVKQALGDADALDGLVAELDRVAHKELGLIASVPDRELRRRVLGLPALSLKRERARLLWALATDEREGAQALATEMVDALQRAAGVHPAANRLTVTSGKEGLSVVPHARDGVTLRVERLERERAEFLAQLGAREAQLREEVQTRSDAVRQEVLLRTRVRELEESQAEIKAQLGRTLVERTPARGDHGARLKELQEKLRWAEASRDALMARVTQMEEHLARTREENKALSTALVARETAAQQRIGRLRESLRDARLQRGRGGEVTAEMGPSPERVALHVDVANLSASAHHHHGARVDFVGLPRVLGDGRNVVLAVAYAVEQGEPERFAGFVHALKGAGYQVRIKKPRTRMDGTVKADWDMGLAMDVVEDVARVDTVILCSGDGDFVPMVELMRRRGKRVEVAAFPADTHDDLVSTAHAFHPLGKPNTRGG